MTQCGDKYWIHGLSILLLIVGSLFFKPNIFFDACYTSTTLVSIVIISCTMSLFYSRIKCTIYRPFLYLWGILFIYVNLVHFNLNVCVHFFAYSLFFLYISTIISDQKTRRFIQKVLSFLIVIMSIYGLVQYSFLNAGDNLSFRIYKPFDNPMGVSVMLSCLLPYLYDWCKQQKSQYCILLTILPITVVILTGMRSAIIALLFCLLILNRHKLKCINRNKLMAAVIFLTLAIFMSGLYYFKKDSANGRLLIWRCSTNLISEKVILGHGYQGFEAKYMLYQAQYFREHPDSEFTMLADDIHSPFNEYILIIVNYGILGFVLVLSLIICILIRISKTYVNEKQCHILCFCVIGLCSLFSYPLSYPFFKIMLVFATANMLFDSKYRKNVAISSLYKPLSGVLLIVSLLIICYSLYSGYCGSSWKYLMDKSFLYSKEKTIARFKEIYPRLKSNASFLYSYSSKLYLLGEYSESKKIIDSCSIYKSSYKSQILKSDILYSLQEYEEALRSLRLASEMCPNRFLPLYKMYIIYKETGDKTNVLRMRNIILNKEVKISSREVNEIKKSIKY